MRTGIFFCEFVRIRRRAWEFFLIQGMTVVIIGLISFLMNEDLSVYRSLNGFLYWLVQVFAIILLSDRIFQRDVLQGFFDNVLNAQIPLSLFCFVRWVMVTVFATLCQLIMMPAALFLLGIPPNHQLAFGVLLFPFIGIITAYGGALSLIIADHKGALLSLLLIPLLIPAFILVVWGTSQENLFSPFLSLLGLLLTVFPVMLGFCHLALKNLSL